MRFPSRTHPCPGAPGVGREDRIGFPIPSTCGLDGGGCASRYRHSSFCTPRGAGPLRHAPPPKRGYGPSLNPHPACAAIPPENGSSEGETLDAGKTPSSSTRDDWASSQLDASAARLKRRHTRCPKRESQPKRRAGLRPADHSFVVPQEYRPRPYLSPRTHPRHPLRNLRRSMYS